MSTIFDNPETELAFGESIKLVNFLTSELKFVQQATNDASSDDGFTSQYRWRFAIKNYCSYIEGVVNQLKSIILSLPVERLEKHFSSEEIMAIREKSHFLKGNGKIGMRDSYDRTQPRVAFVFNSFSNLLSESYVMDKNGGWEELGHSFEVRNRLTHPKDKMGLLLSKDEYDEMVVAARWFDRELKSLLASVTKMLESRKDLGS